MYFDNVGGDILDAALENMNDFGRLVASGMISPLQRRGASAGPAHITNIVTRRLRMQGFIVIDYLPRAAEAIQDLAGWVREGRIAYQEDIQQGFENAPRTFLRLFQSENVGKQLLKLADPPLAGDR